MNTTVAKMGPGCRKILRKWCHFLKKYDFFFKKGTQSFAHLILKVRMLFAVITNKNIGINVLWCVLVCTCTVKLTIVVLHLLQGRETYWYMYCDHLYPNQGKECISPSISDFVRQKRGPLVLIPSLVTKMRLLFFIYLFVN